MEGRIVGWRKRGKERIDEGMEGQRKGWWEKDGWKGKGKDGLMEGGMDRW